MPTFFPTGQWGDFHGHLNFMEQPNEPYQLGEIRLPAAELSISRALEAMKCCFEAQGVGSKIVDQFQLAVAEGLNNAVKHGCLEAGGGEVHFRWGWRPGDALWVEITDPGHFQPSGQEATLPVDLLSECGRGAFLMASLADKVEHQVVERGHMLVLEKSVRQPVSGSRE